MEISQTSSFNSFFISLIIFSPFSEFVNTQPQKQELKSSEKDLAEEAAILSSMAENIAIANKNIVINQTQPEKIQKPQPNKAIQEK